MLAHDSVVEQAGDRYVSGVNGDVFEALGDGRYAVVDGPHGTPSQLPLGAVVTAGRALDTWEKLARPSDMPSGPYLRPAGDGRVPDGWTAEPLISKWAGRDTEVVYNPRRHDVAINWHTKPGEVNDALEATGWRLGATDGPRSFWTRDRHVAARTALARFDHNVGVAASTVPQPQLPDARGL